MHLNFPELVRHPRFVDKMYTFQTIIFIKLLSIPDKVGCQMTIGQKVQCPIPERSEPNIVLPKFLFQGNFNFLFLKLNKSSLMSYDLGISKMKHTSVTFCEATPLILVNSLLFDRVNVAPDLIVCISFIKALIGLRRVQLP